MKIHLLAALPLVAGLALAPAFADEDKDESGKGNEKVKREHRDEKDARRESKRAREPSDRGNYFVQHGHTRIPDGHLPPPGECRLWYPDRPAGHQPPPFKCGGAVPSGAWLLQHPPQAPQHIEAVVYDQRQPGVVVSVGIFDAKTGAFIKVQASR
jgi:hypothetical protein